MGAARVTEAFVIVGAGQAGLQIAETLRHEKYAGPIIMFGAEAQPPYNRPPLSKKFLLDRPDPATLAIRGAEWLQRKDIDLRVQTQVVAIDRERREVVLADHQRVPYAGLALTTGARLRVLPLEGAQLRGVLGLRSLEDALQIGAALDHCVASGLPLVVIGGGFIGLELAATASKKGIAVTVLEGLGRLMSRVVAPIVSEAAATLHRAHGVRLLFDVKISAITGHEGTVRAVQTADGQEFPAGCVIVGVGVHPDDALARAAGLDCERGIIVDECSRTSDPLIVAAGDCCARRCADGSLLRLESVQNAVEQGKAAAAALLGMSKPFTAAPWFWSDQYDLKLQMVGLSAGYDEVVTRGDLAKPAFSAYYFKSGRLMAVDSLSRFGDHMSARKLLDRGVSPTAAQVADESFDLAGLLRAQI